MGRKRKFATGNLIKSKSAGWLGIVEYSYGDAFGGNDNSEYSILWLDDKGKPECSCAWISRNSIELVDDTQQAKYIKMIRKYNRSIGEGAPICMNYELAEKLGYGFVNTYESVRARDEKLCKDPIVIDF